MTMSPLSRLLPAALLLGLVGLMLLGCGADAKKADAPQANAVGAKSWPMFGGTPARNMANPAAKNVPGEWKVEGGPENVKWSAAIGTRGYGGPVVAGGKVYIGTNNDVPRDPKVKGAKAILMCFDEATGKFLWQLAHDMPPPDVARDALRDGLCSTPTVDGDRLYYVTPACVVVCAGTDGKVVWTYDLMKKLGVYPCFIGNCAPLVVGDQVFVITANGRDADNQLPAPKAPSFVALDKKAGTVQWKSDLPGKNILDGQWSNPAYAEVDGKPQVIFPGGDAWLYALDPKTGKLIWKFDCNPKDAVWKSRGTRLTVIATPVVHEGKVYIGTGLYPDHPHGNSSPGHFWCINLANKGGDVSPELVTDAATTPPKTKPNPNSALAWHFGGAIKPAPANGRDTLLGQTISSAAVHDGLVYIAEYAGFLHCLDAKTGKKYWEYDTKSAVWGSSAVIDGRVYLGTDDGDVHVLAAGKVKKELGTREMGLSVLSTPVATNGALYVLTKSKLFAIGK